MCGRYFCNLDPKVIISETNTHIEEWIDRDLCMPTSNSLLLFYFFLDTPTYNVHPGCYSPVLMSDSEGHRYIQTMKWGLIPSTTSQSITKPNHFSMFNSRAESLPTNSLYKRLMTRQRCIILINGYFFLFLYYLKIFWMENWGQQEATLLYPFPRESTYYVFGWRIFHSSLTSSSCMIAGRILRAIRFIHLQLSHTTLRRTFSMCIHECQYLLVFRGLTNRWFWNNNQWIVGYKTRQIFLYSFDSSFWCPYRACTLCIRSH